MKYKSVLFDLDGTLMDSIGDLTDSVNFALQNNGFEIRTHNEVRQFVGNGLYRLIARAVPDGISAEQLKKCYNDMAQYYRYHSMVKSKPYDGVQDMLMELRERGVKTAIITNKIHLSAENIALKYFPTINVVVGDDGYRPLKPAPDGVLVALQKLGCLPSQTILIGDSEVDLQTAQNAGVDCISVLWGFRDRTFLQERGALRFASSCHELSNLLNQ